MNTTATKFDGITAGTLLAAIDGPGQTPTRDGAARTGFVVGIETFHWSTYLVVRCDDGSTEYVMRVKKPTDRGIGWYVIN